MMCWACSAVAQKADIEIGVLTCILGELGKAPASDAVPNRQTREALCRFQPEIGAEETYTGKVQGVSISADQQGTLIWAVKRATKAAVEPGMLQQSYAIDSKQPADQRPPLMGDANTDIVLHSLADKNEGSTSEKRAPTGFVILNLELKLKSASA
jgi:hypothetical protein